MFQSPPRRLAVSLCLALALQLTAVAAAPPQAPAGGQGSQREFGLSHHVKLKHRANVRSLPPAARPARPQESPPERRVVHPSGPPRRQGVQGLALRPAKQPPRGPLAAAQETASQPSAPDSTFVDPAIGQVTEFTGSGFDNFAPPDTQIAVGPDRVIEMMNVNATVFDKAGTQLSTFGLAAFFGTSATFPSFSDPKVLYDAESGRFFAAGLLFDGCNPAPPPKGSGCTTSGNSEIDLAVSDTSDPGGNWTVYVISQRTDNVLQDQPKLGVSSDKITLSWNNNGAGGPYPFFVVQKSDALAGAQNVTTTQFGPYSDRFNIMPAQNLSASNTAYAAFHKSGDAHVSVMVVTGTPAKNDVSITTTELGIAGFSSPPLGNQPNGSGGTGPTIDAGDDRLDTAIWKNDRLWTAGADTCQDSKDTTARSCIRFIQISTSGSPSIATDTDLTLVGGDLYYPAVVLDSGGNLWAGFSGSSVAQTTSNFTIGDMYPTAIVAGVAGATFPPEVPGFYYAQGSGVYNCTFCTNNDGSRRPRFGDYSGAAVDPSKPSDIWVGQEFGSTSTTDTDQWGVAIGRFTFGPVVGSVAPRSVPELSTCSQSVTLSGVNFDGASDVKFGAVSSSSFSVVNSGQITASVPPQSRRTVDVFVTTPVGTSTARPADSFTYQPDTTPPTSNTPQLVPAPNGAGWNRASVTVNLSAADNFCGSGVKSITYSASGAQTIAPTTVNGASAGVSISNEGVTTISYYATDNANNPEATRTQVVRIDATNPQVSCAGPDGAWHATDVSLGCTASDPPPGSGLANPADASFSLSTSVPAGTETDNAQTNSHDVYDVAGNLTTAGPIGGNKVDKKPPSIAITTPPLGSPYLLNQSVAANYACSDGGSGVATCAGPAANGAPIDTASVGTKTFTVDATDNVANASSQSTSYQVTYKICLQYDPTKAVPAGATMSIRVQLCDVNDVNVSSRSITLTAISVLPTGTLSSNSNPGNLFFLSTGMYVYNLSTKSFAPGSYTLQFTASGDPVTHSVPFKLK